MDSKIDLWFPTPIYIADNLLTDEENNSVSENFISLSNEIESGGLNWLSQPYNTLGTFDLRNSDKFSVLLEKVTTHVNYFASHYNTSNTYTCKESWGNLYKQGEYQEYHIHTHSTFSAVYYSKSPKDSGDIVFENPFGIDMMEIQNIHTQNNLTYQNCSYQAIEKRLIIFRSHLRHMVKPGNNQSPRISFAFNY